jgi:hypothetical protein
MLYTFFNDKVLVKATTLDSLNSDISDILFHTITLFESEVRQRRVPRFPCSTIIRYFCVGDELPLLHENIETARQWVNKQVYAQDVGGCIFNAYNLLNKMLKLSEPLNTYILNRKDMSSFSINDENLVTHFSQERLLGKILVVSV